MVPSVVNVGRAIPRRTWLGGKISPNSASSADDVESVKGWSILVRFGDLPSCESSGSRVRVEADSVDIRTITFRCLDLDKPLRFYHVTGNSKMSSHRKSYGQRAADHSNPAAQLLLHTIERKKSNLAVSVDLTKSSDFLKVINAVGPYVCLIKARKADRFIPPDANSLQCLHLFDLQTHIDILEDFTLDVIERLKLLSAKHDFVVFEDRKFADIGAPHFPTLHHFIQGS
jgi:Orotidine 5'-phosphate decarboxylase / HUMPS family